MTKGESYFESPMRYAIISDIHGNLEALKAVLADIRNEQISDIYCLGDIVGYYANPNECIKLVREHIKKTTAGNHDYAALGKVDIHRTFTFYACIAMEWTQKRLTRKSIEYLSSLPLTASIGRDVLLTHSTPSKPDQWNYLFMDSDELVADAFSSFRQWICFNAHTHYPVIMTLKNDRIILHRNKKIKLTRNHQYLINVGSVGQPRDNDSRSCYAIYDTGKQEVYIKRVKYDYSITQKKIMQRSFPDFLALRLEEGR